MKKTTRLIPSIAAFGISLGLIATTQAQQNHFYLKGDIGGTSARDVRLREFFGQAIAPNSNISLDPGIRFGLHAGYGITDWLAGEVETGVMANSIESITGATVTDGSLAHIPLLLNAKFHLPNEYRVSPYVGGGFGLASTILSGDDIIIGGTRFSGTVANAVFAYQAFAGLRVAINDRMGLSVEYHYLHTAASNMRADLTIGTPSDRIKLGETETHSVSVAFDFRF